MKSGQGQKLLATKDETGDVVGLTSLPDEGLDTHHQELESFVCGDGGKIANQIQPTRVGELLARGIESLDNAIGKKHEDVPGMQFHFGRYEGCFGGDAEGQPARLQAFRAAICTSNDGGIVAGIDVREFAGKRMVFGKHRRGETLSPQAMFASIAIQTDGEWSEWQALRSKRAQAGL